MSVSAAETDALICAFRLSSNVALGPEAMECVATIATTALLPITFITGVFGMNVGGLPWSDSKHGFAWVILCMTVTVVVTMLLLRRNRVL